MASDPRIALNRLIAAFERHFEAARLAEGGDERALESAELTLRDAFFTYDDELFTQFGVELPFDLFEDEEDFDDEDDDVDGEALDEDDPEDDDDVLDIEAD